MSKYQEAIDSGYTDEEIKSFLGDKYSNAIKEGYTQQQIEEHLGTPNGFFNPTKQEDNVDAAMTVGGNKTTTPEQDFFGTNNKDSSWKVANDAYDSSINLLQSKYDNSLKEIEPLKGSDEYNAKLKQLDYQLNNSKQNALLQKVKTLKSLGFKVDTEGNPAGALETPVVSPEFAIGGAVGGGGKAVASAVGGDIGAEYGAKAFEKISSMLTPELKDTNPMLYGGLTLLSSIAGGVKGGQGFDVLGGKVSEVANKQLMGTADLLTDIYKDPSLAIKNYIGGTATDSQSLRYVQRISGETQESLNSMYGSYAKALGKTIDDLNDAEKVKAIVQNSNIGGRIKLDAEVYNEGVLARSNNTDEKIRNIFANQSKEGDFNIPALELKRYLKDSSNLYEDAKDALIKYTNNNVKIDPNSVDNLEQSLTKGLYSTDDISAVSNIIKDLKNPNGLDIEQLLEIKKKLNSLNLTSTKKFKGQTVGEFVDNQVKNSIGDDAYHIWQDVNKRYSAKLIMQEDNQLGQLLNKFGDATISSKTLADEMYKIGDTGYKTFNQLRNAIGEKEASKVELGMAKNLLNSKEDMSNVIEKLSKFDFATVEGRNLQEQLDNVKGLVSDKDAKGLLSKIVGSSSPSIGWSDSIISKLKYSIVGKMFNTLMTRLPSGADERALTNIGTIIKENPDEFNFKIRKDELYDSTFKKQEQELKDRVNSLKQKGEARTAKENEELAKATQEINTIKEALSNSPKMIEFKPTDFITTPSGKTMSSTMKDESQTIMTAEKVSSELNRRAEGRTSYNPKGQFEDIKASQNKPIETIIEEQKGIVPYNAKPKANEDIIDVDVIERNKPKTLTEEQSIRYDDIASQIADKQKEIQRIGKAQQLVSKQNTTEAKKQAMIKDYAQQLRELSAELTTLNKKLPKK